MADGTELNAGSGGDVIATDDITDAGVANGQKVQRVKVGVGVDNAYADVSDSNPLPIDDAGGSITVDNAGTFAVQAGVDSAVYVDDADWTDSTSSHVLVGGLYQSTEQTITDGDVGPFQVDANGRLKVSIEVDNAGIGGGTQYAEDAAHTTGDTGTMALVVRNDTRGALAGTTGDYSPLQVNSSGDLRVEVSSYADSQVDDAAYTVATDSLAVIGGVVTADSVESGDAGAFAMSTDRHQIVDAHIVAQDAAVTIADGGGSITVDGTVAATQSGTWNVTNISGTVSLPTGAATAANQSTGNTSLSNIQTAVQLIDNPVLAHDSAVGTTQTMMAGARATNNIEGLTQVAANDGTRVTADLNGCLVTRPHTTLEEHISERVSDTAGTSTNFTNFAAGGAGIHNYVCDVTITNTSSTDGYVDLRDGSAGSIIWTFPAPANSGATHSFSLPLKGAANTALAYDVSGALSTVFIAVNGFQAQG